MWHPFDSESTKTDKGDAIYMEILNACFSPDGKSLALEKSCITYTGINRSTATMAVVFDLGTRKERWREHAKGASRDFTFAFAPDGKRMAMTVGGGLSLQDVATGRQLAGGPLRFDGRLAFSPDGGTVAMHCDRAVAFWSLDDTTSVAEILLCDHGSSAPAYSPDGKRMAVNTSIRFQVLDVATRKPAINWVSHDKGLKRVTFSVDGTCFFAASGSFFPDVECTGTATWSQKWQSEDVSSRFNDFQAATMDHALCVARDGKHRDALFDMKTSQVVGHLDAPELKLTHHWGFFSPTSGLYVMYDSESNGKEIDTVFAIPSGKKLYQLASRMSTLAWSFSADDSRAAFFQSDGIIRVHDTATGKLVWQLGQADPFWDSSRSTLALSADGNMVAEWAKNRVLIWDVRTGRHNRLSPVEPVAEGRVCLAWSPDCRMLAVGGLDNAIRLWEVATARVRHEFHGHEAPACCLAFSPDGRLLASGSKDTSVLVWDVWGGRTAGPDR
jgi:WD40 repeat protein